MTTSNVEIVRNYFDFFLAGKIEEATNCLADDFVLDNPLPEKLPFGGQYLGPAGFMEYVGQIAGSLEMLEFSVDDIMSDGDKVVVVGREKSKFLSNGGNYEMAWVHVIQLREGLIHMQREYNDTALMLAAFEEKT